MVDLEDISRKYHTYLDGVEYLARAVESGEHLGPEARKLIAGLLRKEITLPRGPKRTAAQAELEGKIVFEIMSIVYLWGVSEYRAKIMFLNQNPDVNEETLTTYLKNARNYETSKWGQNFRPKRVALDRAKLIMATTGHYKKGFLSGEVYNASCSDVLERKIDR